MQTKVNQFHKSEQIIDLESKHSAHNYHPLPVVLSRGEGVKVWDTEGKEYYDFLASYSAVNQGHSHPKILQALVDQAQKLALTSRAFYNDKFHQFARFVTEYFGYDKVLPMNTGAEAVETAIKIARRWGYQKKNIAENQAKIIVCENNFHGRTISIISASTDPDSRQHFGPYTPGFIQIPYDDIDALRATLDAHSSEIAAFLVEPIQGEAGVKLPSADYISRAYELCKSYDVLFIADEIQTGLGRTGKRLAIDHAGIQADMITLGKALSGGLYPVSAVLADDHVMEVITPGSHGSTYGGNPIASHLAIHAIEAIEDEGMIENSYRMGTHFRGTLKEKIGNLSIIKEIRGLGLMNAIEINDDPSSSTAWDICVSLMKNGLLAKPTHGNIIRFTPPLVITEEQITEAEQIIANVISHHTLS